MVGLNRGKLGLVWKNIQNWEKVYMSITLDIQTCNYRYDPNFDYGTKLWITLDNKMLMKSITEIYVCKVLTKFTNENLSKTLILIRLELELQCDVWEMLM